MSADQLSPRVSETVTLTSGAHVSAWVKKKKETKKALNGTGPEATRSARPSPTWATRLYRPGLDSVRRSAHKPAQGKRAGSGRGTTRLNGLEHRQADLAW